MYYRKIIIFVSMTLINKTTRETKTHIGSHHASRS